MWSTHHNGTLFIPIAQICTLPRCLLHGSRFKVVMCKWWHTFCVLHTDGDADSHMSSIAHDWHACHTHTRGALTNDLWNFTNADAIKFTGLRESSHGSPGMEHGRLFTHGAFEVPKEVSNKSVGIWQIMWLRFSKQTEVLAQQMQFHRKVCFWHKTCRSELRVWRWQNFVCNPKNTVITAAIHIRRSNYETWSVMHGCIVCWPGLRRCRGPCATKL